MSARWRRSRWWIRLISRSSASITVTTARPVIRKCHTSLGVDPEKIAAGSGIKATRTITSEEELAGGACLLREGNGTAFVLLRVKPADPPAFKRKMDPPGCRNRFRTALLGAA